MTMIEEGMLMQYSKVQYILPEQVYDKYTRLHEVGRSSDEGSARYADEVKQGGICLTSAGLG